MLTVEDLAKYPFLKKASLFVESYALTFQDLASDEYSYIVQRAVDRVRRGIEGRRGELNLADPSAEVLAYPLALAFVYSLRQGWVVRRFANTEQKACFELLKHENREKVEEVGRDGFDWDLESAELRVSGALFDFSLPVEDYLEVAPSFHSPDWKLVNRHVSGGRVYLKHVEVARLISEALKTKILRKAEEEEVKRFNMPDRLLSKFQGIEALLKEAKNYDEGAVVEPVEGAKPPCIVALLKDLAAGKSLSHMARFTVTTFLINTGESVEDVLKRFSNVADFDEGKARYQVEHIAGLIGSKTRYKPPKCDVLRSFGLCIGGDAYCKRVRHPLQYYKMRVRELKGMDKDKGKGKSKS